MSTQASWMAESSWWLTADEVAHSWTSSKPINLNTVTYLFNGPVSFKRFLHLGYRLWRISDIAIYSRLYCLEDLHFHTRSSTPIGNTRWLQGLTAVNTSNVLATRKKWSHPSTESTQSLQRPRVHRGVWYTCVLARGQYRRPRNTSIECAMSALRLFSTWFTL